MQGRLKWIDKTRGFGVITSEEGKDVFLYCTPPCERFREGDKLEFKILDGEKPNEATKIHSSRFTKRLSGKYDKK